MNLRKTNKLEAGICFQGFTKNKYGNSIEKAKCRSG